MPQTTSEHRRLGESKKGQLAWKKWGPYLSERQWGTVREDYSGNGDAWNYFTHDMARSRAYRWGEDGLAGISDDKQLLCFALALWNGNDPILKERLFGLTNSEGNHGEDVKEYYFYLDSTPTHSYMKYLYKYPQAAYPYDDLVKTNAKRTRFEPEYELTDTGVFDSNRYFDVFVEYCKDGPDDILIQITAANRGDQAATLHLLPHLWFRNTWTDLHGNKTSQLPRLRSMDAQRTPCVEASHPKLGTMYLHVETCQELLFTNNETNTQRIFGRPNVSPYVKDAFHRYVIEGKQECVNRANVGTKSAAYCKVEIPAKGEFVMKTRLTRSQTSGESPFGKAFDEIFERCRQEADEFYQAISSPRLSPEERMVMRQALAGMLWSKQYYYFDIERWLEEHGGARWVIPSNIRNSGWAHMLNDDVISMPDKWEYPWYAAWDLAFHAVAISVVDMDFAKAQLLLMLNEMYQHPNGQVPAYEWNFGDVNPPVHAWAAFFIYLSERQRTGKGDTQFLKLAFQKLLMNFTWWVNRKDRDGRNIFEGGFLGLDNIGIFDRSAPLPTGGFMEQADGTAWMAFFCQSMLQIALELAPEDSVYVDMAQKFIEHFLRIAGAMDRIGINPDELWDEEDGFFYDLLRLPDGTAQRIKVRSIVGLLPLCASTVIAPELIDRFPNLIGQIDRFCQRNASLIANLASPTKPGHNGRFLFSILTEEKLRRVLTRMLDEDRFFGPHGVRALSRWHKDHPYVLSVHGEEYRVEYMPAESTNGMFGGNSNWRGPVWMPINVLIIRALLSLYRYYGKTFTIECPTGSGVQMNLFEVAKELSRRLVSTFLNDANGRRPVFGGARKFQEDPHWHDCILFYEYFHGDNGAGIGASHQTGWTGVVAELIALFGYLAPDVFLETPDFLRVSASSDLRITGLETAL
jgi:hypothetical protein